MLVVRNIIFVYFLGLIVAACQHGPPLVRKSLPARCLTEHRIPSMGTFFELQLVHACSYNPESEILKIRQLFDQIETELSLYQPESEVSKLNRAGHLCTSSIHLLKLVALSKEFTQKTNGAFDITILPVLKEIETNFKRTNRPPKALVRFRPLVGGDKIHLQGNCIRFELKGMAITLDGIAKGYAVDEAAKLLPKAIDAYLLNFSGNMLWKGEKPDGSWRIALWNPVKQEVIPISPTEEGAIASSGPENAYFDIHKKWHHIISPKTLRPPERHAAVTAKGPSAMVCDVMSTSLMNLTFDQAEKIRSERFPEYSLCFFDSAGLLKTLP